MSEVSIGQAIFTSIKPLTKVAALAGCGALFAKKGILDVATCKSMASVVINGFLPMLIFASTITSFSLDNISEAGTVLLSAAFFTVFGLVFGLICRFVTPVGRWKMGIIANNMWSNNADLVIGIISTLAQTKPFGGTGDYEKGVSYSSIFAVFTFLTLYSMGGIQMIQRDFAARPQLDDEVGHKTKQDNPAGASVQRSRGRQAPASASQNHEREPPEYEEKDWPRTTTTIAPAPAATAGTGTAALAKTTSLDVNIPPEVPTVGRTTWERVMGRVKLFVTIPTMTLISALVIAIVPYLRALFMPTNGVSMPNAPDGRPPLDFIIQFASYGGQLSPVMGIAMLGAALSRIRVRHLPKGFWISIAATCVLKLILGPILGILWIQGLKRTPLINENQRMMQLVIAITGASKLMQKEEMMQYFARKDSKLY
ncbi:Protein M3, variant 3 [Orbilia brochopaga]|uniref:Protein M3, variant 3 n=1 Tax=Orbilia brochopaga TaxID=3140254 RepID=A0AAV9TY09_9PEZI